MVIFLNCSVMSFSQSNNISEITDPIPPTNTMKHNAFSFGLEQVFSNGKFQNGLNFSYEIFVSKNVSLNYSLGFGLEAEGNSFHTTLGLAGLYYGLKNIDKWGEDSQIECSDSYDNNYTDCVEKKQEMQYSYLCFLALLPEGINVYLPLGENFNLITYFDILGFEYRDNQSSIASNLGLKLGIKLANNTYLEPRVGMRINFSRSEPCMTWGINLKSSF